MKQLCACCRMGWEVERPGLPTSWFELTLTGCDLDAGKSLPERTHIATVAICPHCTLRLLGQGPEVRQQEAQAGLREAILNSMKAGELTDSGHVPTHAAAKKYPTPPCDPPLKRGMECGADG